MNVKHHTQMEEEQRRKHFIKVEIHKDITFENMHTMLLIKRADEHIKTYNTSNISTDLFLNQNQVYWCYWSDVGSTSGLIFNYKPDF